MKALALTLLLLAGPLAAQQAVPEATQQAVPVAAQQAEPLAAPQAGAADPEAAETPAYYAVAALVLGALGLIAGLAGAVMAVGAKRAAGAAQRQVDLLNAEKRRELPIPAKLQALEAKVKALEQTLHEAQRPAAAAPPPPGPAPRKTLPVTPVAPAPPAAPALPAEPRLTDDAVIAQAVAAFNALVAQPTPAAVTRFENEQGADADGPLWRLPMAGVGELVFPGPDVVRNWGRQFRGLPGAGARDRALGEWYEVESGDVLHVEHVARRGTDGTIVKGVLRGA